MLILTRRIGEALIIGDDTKVILLNVHGNQVRLGIDAPEHISVHREEIQRRIEAERNKSGAKAIKDDVKKAVGGNSRPTLSRSAV